MGKGNAQKSAQSRAANLKKADAEKAGEFARAEENSRRRVSDRIPG